MKMKYGLKIAAAALAIACLAPVLEAQQPTDPQRTLSLSEVKDMRGGTSNPDDYLKLSAYFRQVAKQEEDTASFHEAMVAMYQDGHMPSMQGMSRYDTESHCKEFAKNARKAAAKDLKMAASYEKEAEILKDAPPSHGAHR